jgi:hypothetical protein
MTNQRIIHPTPDGGIAVVVPSGTLPIEDVALKDVPAGAPYLLATVDDIPADRTFRGAWEADFTTPDGEGIGADAWFAAQQPAPEPAPEEEPAP